MRENRKLLTYIALSLLLLLSVGGIYGYLAILSPMHNSIVAVDSEIQQLRTYLEKSGSFVEEVSPMNQNTFLFQEEVPVKPLIDQLMLQFEKAEVLSDSLILTMQFSDGEVKDEEELAADGVSNEESDQIESQPAPSAQDATSQSKTTVSDNKVIVTPETLPDGVKKITAELSVVSKDYNGLINFLTSIQKMKRVTVIEAITFTGLDEIEMASAEVTPDQLKYEVTIAAYYLPELTDYLKDLPRGEFPAPEGKENPLITEEE
ncbi:hypothetical protein KUV80_10260 [Fictibacillus nanhaiensis]|uniref:hypothetical protein n=1 Tax=Fictibacillus nanhaiensis TaxID=742169 RepID=UPI001C97BB97|nr:hypothetical protein [Fictibacillus nanhaiensis]MBY6037041.1 hypothetical protein [Fictibacillus nanhaiensis]